MFLNPKILIYYSIRNKNWSTLFTSEMQMDWSNDSAASASANMQQHPKGDDRGTETVQHDCHWRSIVVFQTHSFPLNSTIRRPKTNFYMLFYLKRLNEFSTVFLIQKLHIHFTFTDFTMAYAVRRAPCHCMQTSSGQLVYFILITRPNWVYLFDSSSRLCTHQKYNVNRWFSLDFAFEMKRLGRSARVPCSIHSLIILLCLLFPYFCCTGTRCRTHTDEADDDDDDGKLL